ncbi:DUF1573 domain-containing protein [Parabacteroides sp. PF5-6]|uniref:DUF1573 domain-containing protein n=1 Tax=Parabacteroides sp. PF5-6 TaxID=1742403 RepID=UPI00240731C0|nr:DUF1573 domain-containing protein [Parabacteroides sp. PF5-6]MDF9830593.1 hypothetical protein [Parabacteroides sp. PF5-6]
MKRPYLFLLCIFIFVISSCKETEKERITRLEKEWQGKTVVFPQKPVFTLFADTLDWQVPDSEYKVLAYVDSTGCVSCKLQLLKWREWIREVETVTGKAVPFVFFFHAKKPRDIIYTMKRDQFDYPVCLDTEGELNRLNHFPTDMAFQTFLLDRENRVVVIGNPIHSPSVKELYLKHITGGKIALPDSTPAIRTTARLLPTAADMGIFERSEKKTVLFRVVNTGSQPLVIIDWATTCSCARVTFDKHPAEPGKTLSVEVEMTPAGSGAFNEMITLRCNTDEPLYIRISGEALE